VVSRALATAVGLGRELAARTGGAFDPTIAPLAKLWQSAARRPPRPAARELERARRLVGWRSIEIAPPRVALRARGMALDLGALGKRIALDRIARHLRRGGCPSALVNFGESSLVAIGRPPRGRWRVALRHPEGGFAGEFALDDRACSTSATWGQTVRLGRTVLGHIVDPRTGKPLRRHAQVTVLAPSATVAEALSTALVAAYYRGGEDATVMTFPKTFGQLLEVTHAHAFMMAVIFLILAHLFAATSTSGALRAIVLGVAFAGMLGNLAAPWLTRYGAAWCAWILLFSWAAQGAGSVLMVAVSAWDCLTPSW